MNQGGAVLQRGSALPDRRIPESWRLARWLLPMLAAVCLCGCASINERLAGAMSQAPGFGEPAETPARPADPMAYPAVHDTPPPRNSVLLTGIEQKKFEDDLLAARDQQRRLAGEEEGKPEAKPAEPPKPAAPPKSAGKPPAKTPAGKKLARQQRASEPQPPPTQPAYIPPASGRAIY